MNTNVYIDGFNLYYGALKDTPYKWLDPQALVQALLPISSIGRMRYFSARVWEHLGNPGGRVRQEAYWRALRTLPALDIIEGRLDSRDRWYPVFPLQYHSEPGAGSQPVMARVSRIEEKRTDVNIAAYLLLDCFKGEYERAVVISNDSDLSLPIRMVRDDFGKEVIIVNPVRSASRGAKELARASTGMIHRVNTSLLARCQFPSRLTDAKGTFSKPPSW